MQLAFDELMSSIFDRAGSSTENSEVVHYELLEWNPPHWFSLFFVQNKRYKAVFTIDLSVTLSLYEYSQDWVKLDIEREHISSVPECLYEIRQSLLF
jgi:hypothetical protein